MKINDILEWNRKAINMRKYFGCSDSGFIDIERVVESQEDITLIFCEFSDDISGLSIKDVNNKIIAINSRLSKGRQRFTIAHELCHLYFHDNSCYVSFRNISQVKLTKEEYEADLFATYFLAPYNDFKDACEKYLSIFNKQETIVYLEHFFGLSHIATLTRMRQVGYLSSKEYEVFAMEKPSRLSAYYGLSNHLFLPSNINQTSGKYIRKVNKLYQNNKISTGKYEELLLDAFRDDLVYGDYIDGGID